MAFSSQGIRNAQSYYKLSLISFQALSLISFQALSLADAIPV